MMRKVAVALLSGAYVCIAASVAALFWRSGAGWPVIVSGFAGVLALCFTLHNFVGRSLDAQVLRRELADLRAAHRILADNVESAHDVVETLTQTMQLEAAERTQAIVSEVRMLEDLVERMGETMQARLSTPHPMADAGRGERPDRQRAVLLQSIREALAEGRVDLYLQPVVSLPQRRTAYYESFSRLRDDTGRVMMPSEYLAVAEPEGLMSAIDNLLLFRCVQIVRKLAKQDRKVGIFCNISPASLSDQDFFPQFLKFMGQNKDLASALIFELGQQAFHDRSAQESRNMGRLADLGFRFSVDKVNDIDLDFHDLNRADVKFVKISAKLLLDELVEADDGVILRSMPDLHAADFAALSRRYGVELIAEKVEAEREVIDVLELDIAYGQGHLFGEPRAIKEAVLAETAPPPEMTRGLRRSVGR